MEKRIKIKGTGSQAPYGIGEIIKTFPDTPAGLKKAIKYARKWYDTPRVVMPSGSRVDPYTGEKYDY